MAETEIFDDNFSIKEGRKHRVSATKNIKAGNRGRVEIIGDILSVCASGQTKKTHIMYRGNLSHDMLKTYVDELRKRGLIEIARNQECTITASGQEFLRHYWRIKELLAAALDLSDDSAETVSEEGARLASLGMSEEFIRNAKISTGQARDIIKGILYLEHTYKGLRDGN